MFLKKGFDTYTIMPCDVFEVALKSVTELATKRGIKINVEGKEILDSYKHGIPWASAEGLPGYELYTAFWNLMQNAVKYSPDGSTIEVKFAEEVKDGIKHFVFAVSDNGIGILEKDKPDVLKKRRRGSNVGKIEGTGYGLYRINSILTKVGSKLDIVSPLEANRGTKVGFSLELQGK